MKLKDSERSGLLFGGFFLVLVIAFFLSFNLTGNVVVEIPTGESFYSVNEGVGNFYNVTIENTELTEDLDIIEVNITLPNSFSFLEDSNGTDSGEHLFTEGDSVLSWSGEGLVMNLVSKNFWFNATASTPGNYNLTITLTNSTGSESFNLLTIVNDTTVPSSIEFVSPSESNYANLSKSNIDINLTAIDNGELDILTIKLFNSTDEINSSVSSISPLFVNFAGLSEGIYYFNATVNDVFGNANSTSTRTITLDITDPVVTLIAPEDAVSSTTADYDFTFSVEDLQDISSCILTIDDSEEDDLSDVYRDGETNELSFSSLSVLEHTWSVSCTDSAGNVGTSSTRTLTVTNETSETVDPETATTGAEISGDVVNGEADLEVEPVVEEIVSGGSSGIRYEQEFLENENLSLAVNEEIHIFSVKNISNESVEITIFSNPQDAVFLIGEEKKFDVSEDGYYDLLVRLNSINVNEEGFFKTNFTIEVINGSISVLDGDSENDLIKDKFKVSDFFTGEMSSIGWFILVLVLMLLTFAILKLLKSKGSKTGKNSKRVKIKNGKIGKKRSFRGGKKVKGKLRKK